MARNDVVFLDKVLEHRAAHGPSDLDEAEFFELFSAEQILKDRENREPTYEELELGRLGGGDEGGIDSFFVFVDGILLEEGEEFLEPRKGAELVIHAIQSKRATGFSELAVQRMSDTFEHILDLTKSREELENLGLYHSTFLDRVELARDALRTLAPFRPKVTVEIAFATRGEAGALNPKVAQRAKLLEEQIEAELDKPTVKVAFYGAGELLALSRKEPSKELELVYKSTPQEDGENGYIALVEIEDYYVFEGNVRDFQGKTDVNKAIRASLDDPEAPQFWWLNNGVTIVCTGTRLMNKRFFIEEPLVVNGLQTSLVLFDYFKTRPKPKKDKKDGRLILVRVIQTEVASVRDAVISATNRQTPVSAASLRATEKIHRDIEQYFESHGWYYDRRKNYWKNRNKSANQIVSITHLAQAVMAIGRQRPDEARGRPGSIFTSRHTEDGEGGDNKVKHKLAYEDVFPESLDPEIYLWAALTLRRVERFLHKHPERLNYKFHLGMLVAFTALRKRVFAPSALKPLIGKSFTDKELQAGLDKLEKALSDFRGSADTPTDRIAKNPDFVRYLLDRHFPGQPKKTAVKKTPKSDLGR